ncbi:MAG: hypothetical protein PUE00_12965 [Thermobifida fusca]|nr:hypothetical protein [Thermobifida fusca]HLU44037.1 hypothetical protein [Natronosporangium sp.]
MALRTIAAAVAATTLVALPSTGVPVLTGPDTGTGCVRTLLDVPRAPGRDDVINGIHPVSEQQVWFTGRHAAIQPWVLRADGDTVSQPVQPVTPLGGAHYSVAGGSFSSDTEGWMLTSNYASRFTTPTAQRWDGQRWVTVPLAISPDPRTRWASIVNAVVSVSSTDAWAVGSFTRPPDGLSVTGAMIQRWDGTTWQLVDNPADQLAGAGLEALHVISPDEVWAVGRQVDPLTGHGIPLVMRWDGHQWETVPTPGVVAPATLTAVSGTSAKEVWVAGGQTMAGTENLAEPLIMRWDGSEWTVMELPAVGNALLQGIYASGDQVWAVGQFALGLAPYFLYYDGAQWTAEPAPGPTGPGFRHDYRAVNGAGSEQIWIAGTVLDWNNERALTARVIRLTCASEEV